MKTVSLTMTLEEAEDLLVGVATLLKAMKGKRTQQWSERVEMGRRMSFAFEHAYGANPGWFDRVCGAMGVSL